MMHHSHKTQSLIYDYRGKEEYIGNYIMTDLNIGSKLNVIYGVREEKNTTTYKAFVGLEGPLPHFNALKCGSGPSKPTNALYVVVFFSSLTP